MSTGLGHFCSDDDNVHNTAIGTQSRLCKMLNSHEESHLGRGASCTARRVSCSAATGLFAALLFLCLFSSLYFFILLLYQPDQRITPPGQLLQQIHLVSMKKKSSIFVELLPASQQG